MMEIDPVTEFLQNAIVNKSKRFSVAVFIHVHSRLSVIQMNKGSIAFEDLVHTINLSLNSGPASDMQQDINAYAGLIYEASFQPLMLSRGPGFKLDRSMVGNEGNFLKAVLQVLLNHTGGKESAVVEELRSEMAAFLKKTGSNVDVMNLGASPSPSISAESTDNRAMKFQHGALSAPQPAYHHSNAYESNRIHHPPPPPRVKVSAIYSREDAAYAEEARALLHAGNEIERQEPILRLLAHIRKAGMDILFPQVLHDKVIVKFLTS